MDFYIFSNNIWDIHVNSYNFIGIYPEIFLIFIILFLITYLVIYDYLFKYKLILQSLTSFLSFLFLNYLIFLLINNLSVHYLIFQSLLINDLFSLYIKLIITIFIILIIILSFDYLKKEIIINYEYFIILLLSFLGLCLLISSYDLITMYLAVELQSLCFYILATFKQYSNFSTEAGIKYFILGAFSSGILLFGCSILYGFTGLTNFNSLQILFQNQYFSFELYNSILISILFIFIGFLFKLSVAPFHMWAPDVYEGSPTIITAFFAIIPKIAILALLIRFYINFFNYNLLYLDQMLLLCSFLSLLLGSLGALYQIKIKRFLAYSSISHMGFILIALAIMSIESFYSLIFYIIIYMFLSICIFSIILNIRKYTNFLKFKKINDLILLLKSNNSIAIIFVLILFSLAGIPPLVGFYSKLYIFIIGIQTKYYLIIIFAALISVLSAMYYIRLIKIIYFKQYFIFTFLFQISWHSSLIIALSFLINFIFLLLPNIITFFLHNLILNLFI